MILISIVAGVILAGVVGLYLLHVMWDWNA